MQYLSQEQLKSTLLKIFFTQKSPMQHEHYTHTAPDIPDDRLHSYNKSYHDHGRVSADTAPQESP